MNLFRARRHFDKFAIDELNGNRKLTADGCFQRHNIPREQMYLTDRENLTRSFGYRNRAEREEELLLSQVTILKNQGIKISSNESLEDFVANHWEELGLQGV